MWTAQKIALFPTPVKVCGVTLLPPSVGALRVLEHLESPFVSGGQITAPDVYGAVAVCAWSYRRAVWSITKRAPFAWAIYRIGKRVRKLRLAWQDEAEKLRRFIHECCWVPERFKEEGEPQKGPNGVPASYRIVDCLLGKFTEREILNMPMPKANLYILAGSANKGSEFEALEQYIANGLPEAFAYHEEDFPDIREAMDRNGKAQAAFASAYKAYQENRNAETVAAAKAAQDEAKAAAEHLKETCAKYRERV